MKTLLLENLPLLKKLKNSKKKELNPLKRKKFLKRIKDNDTPLKIFNKLQIGTLNKKLEEEKIKDILI